MPATPKPNVPSPATVAARAKTAAAAETQKAASKASAKATSAAKKAPKTAAKTTNADKPKKPFVRPERMTDRPLKEHQGLQELQKKMANTTPKEGTPKK